MPLGSPPLGEVDDKSFDSAFSPWSSLGILYLGRESLAGYTTSPSPVVLGFGLDFLPLPGPLPFGDMSGELPGDMADRKLESLERFHL